MGTEARPHSGGRQHDWGLSDCPVWWWSRIGHNRTGSGAEKFITPPAETSSDQGERDRPTLGVIDLAELPILRSQVRLLPGAPRAGLNVTNDAEARGA